MGDDYFNEVSNHTQNIGIAAVGNKVPVSLMDSPHTSPHG